MAGGRSKQTNTQQLINIMNYNNAYNNDNDNSNNNDNNNNNNTNDDDNNNNTNNDNNNNNNDDNDIDRYNNSMKQEGGRRTAPTAPTP